MRKIFLFMMISLDGFMEGTDHDLGWHMVDEEFREFAISQLQTVDTILFGRKTYEMMADFWSAEMAKKTDPQTAELMNATKKIVFSNTLQTAHWENTTLGTDLVDTVQQLHHQQGKDIAIFGSNTLCLSLLEHHFLDEVRIMVNPIILGNGTVLWKGIQQAVHLDLGSTRVFHNGNVLLTYTPVERRRKSSGI